MAGSNDNKYKKDEMLLYVCCCWWLPAGLLKISKGVSSHNGGLYFYNITAIGEGSYVSPRLKNVY